MEPDQKVPAHKIIGRHQKRLLKKSDQSNGATEGIEAISKIDCFGRFAASNDEKSSFSTVSK